MRPEQGWYPDPTNNSQLRWWDGNAWTAQTRSAEGAVPVRPAEPVQPVQSPEPAQPAKPTEPVQPQQGQPQYRQQPVHQSQQQYGQQQYGQHQYSTIAGPGSSPYPAQPHIPMGGQLPLASPWWRLGARVIDWLIMGAIGAVLIFPWLSGFVAALDAAQANPTDPLAIYREPGYQNYLIASWVISILVHLAYEATMLRLRGATVGKLICGLRVEAESGAERLSWGQAIGRVLVMLLPNFVTCSLWTIIDSLWCLWDPKRQCLHDKPVKTRVVATR